MPAAQRTLIKIYAGLHPAGAAAASALRAGSGAVGGEPWLFQEGDLLRIAFEGLYFPEDELLETLERALPREARGRVDVLDLDAWELRRYERKNGRFTLLRRPLNHVLEYAGHGKA